MSAPVVQQETFSPFFSHMLRRITMNLIYYYRNCFWFFIQIWHLHITSICSFSMIWPISWPVLTCVCVSPHWLWMWEISDVCKYIIKIIPLYLFYCIWYHHTQFNKCSEWTVDTRQVFVLSYWYWYNEIIRNKIQQFIAK